MARKYISMLVSLYILSILGYSASLSYQQRADGFTVTAPQPIQEPIEGDPINNGVRFHYVIAPWPPPCEQCKPNNPAYKKYAQVDFYMRRHLAAGSTRTLCHVRYTQGIYEENTGKCNESEARMPPYEDNIPNGMLFELYDVTYEQDNATYSLLVQYGNPDIVQEIQVHVQVPPSMKHITSSVTPEKPEYDVGDKVSMTCRINKANPGASFEWTRGLTEPVVPVDGGMAGSYEEESYSTIERTLYKGDSGVTYICTAHNEVGTSEVTASFALTVQYPPQITLEPCKQQDMNYQIQEGKDAQFTCTIDANPETTYIRWYSGATPEFQDGQEIADSFNKSTLLVRNVTAASDLKVYYWCQANNHLATTQGRCMLDVHYEPRIAIPTELSVREGENVDVTCIADANPAVETYEWKLVGQPDSHLGDDKLHIDRVSPEAAGSYECVAINRMVSGQYTARKQMELHVLFPARARQYSLWKSGSKTGEEVTLTCDLLAYPDLTFTWRFNGKVLGSNSDRSIEHDGQSSTLTIHAVKADDYGEYECSTQNSQGTRAFKALLLKPGKPDRPQECFPREATDNDVWMDCILGYGGGETFTFYVERQDGKKRRKVELTVSYPDDEDNHSSSDITVPYAIVSLHQLPPSTNHTLYIYQDNSHGRSEDMITMHVKTEAGNTVAPPVDRGPSVGALVGASIGSLLILAILVAVAVAVFWKFGDYGCTSAQSMTYSSIGKEEGQENPAFLKESGRDSSVPNEYVMVPGMTRSRPPSNDRPMGEGAVVRENTQRKSGDGRPKSYHDAVMLRVGQSNLAGMGALSHNSTRNLAATGAELDQPNAPPRSKRAAPTDPRWEIPRSHMKIQEKLGEGAYGEVWKGALKGEGNAYTTVAVKFLRDNSPREEQEALRMELMVMKQLKPHPNLVGLLGCCSMEDPLFILMEYAELGNLQEFLRCNRSPQQQGRGYRPPKSSTLTSRDLTVFALHVACGMEYIVGKQFLHRDLAARNVLVDVSMTCKIGDFGLARDIINTRQYESKTQRRLPIRWMAPESLFDSVYSSASDVWAFGVLLWEVVTLGSTPYPGLAGHDIMELLRKGYRMDRPRLCAPHMYELMRSCWQDSPRGRPTFPALRKQLENHLWELEQGAGDDIISVHNMSDNLFSILHDQPGEKC